MNKPRLTAWKEWADRWRRDPLTIFTFLLVVVGAFQWHTLEKTDETAKAAQRASIFINDAELLPHNDGTPTSWWVVPLWENGGNIAAQELTFHINLVLAELPRGFTRCNIPAEQPRITIGPHSISKVAVFPIDSAILNKLREGSLKDAQIWGWAQYLDGVGTNRITRFCWKPTGLTGDPNKADSKLRMIHTLCSEGNCTDSECQKEDQELHPGLPLKKCDMQIITLGK